MNDLTRNIVLWVVIAIVLLAVFSNFGQRAAAPEGKTRFGYTQSNCF